MTGEKKPKFVCGDCGGKIVKDEEGCDICEDCGLYIDTHLPPLTEDDLE